MRTWRVSFWICSTCSRACPHLLHQGSELKLKGAPFRQVPHAFETANMVHSEHPFDHESSFSHYLALLALGMEEEVRGKLESAVAGSGGDFRHAPPKAFGRMETKRTADHKDDPAPKGASNVDVLRGGATYEATDLPKGYSAVAEAFGGCRRVKNGFVSDRETSMDVNFGYRLCCATICTRLRGRFVRSRSSS
jgi:hypothetical protein